MKQFILILMLCCGTAHAATDAAYGVRYTPAELRLTMPDDSTKPYVTVFGTGTRYETVKSWFNAGELKRLKDNSHFNAIDTQSVIFKDRYASSTPGKLTIRIQDGNSVYEIADGQIPLTAEAFVRQTNKAECFRRKTCPSPPPQRDPEPQPLPAPPSPKPTLPWLLLGILAIAGAIAGAHNYFRKLYQGQ